MQSNNITPNDILRHSKESGEISYINTNDSLGIHEIGTDDKEFIFSSGEEKSQARAIISELLVNNLVIHDAGVFYRITEKGYAELATKSTRKSNKIK